MTDKDAIIKCVAGFIFSIAAYLFGAMDGLMKALITFVVIDYITGIIAAAVKRKLNSAVGFKGIAKKVMIFALIAVANIVDTQVLGGSKSLFRSWTIGFYIANEGLSILENVGKFVKYPKKLRQFLEQLREKSDSEEDENGKHV